MLSQALPMETAMERSRTHRVIMAITPYYIGLNCIIQPLALFIAIMDF